MNAWIEKAQKIGRMMHEIYEYLISIGYTSDEAEQLLKEAFFDGIEEARNARGTD